MANDYTDKFETSPYYIKKGEQLSAAGMTAALNTKEKVTNKKNTIIDSSTEYPSSKAVYAHTSNTSNPHGVTAAQVGARPASWTPGKADVGLGNVDNTSDANKPISTAVQTTLSNLNFFPRGIILMMDGNWEDGRGGWYICDGRNTPYGNTPNLTNKFIRGGGTSSGGTGNGQMTLTTAHLPEHKHSITDKQHLHSYGRLQTFTTGQSASGAPNYIGDVVSNTGYAYTGITETNNSTGGGQAFDVIPAYYAVIYIKKMA